MSRFSKLEKEPTIFVKKRFALHDFDERRILSRKFFSDLNLPSMTDKELLRSFDISSVDGAEKAIVKFVEMRESVKKYRERLTKHSRKLEDVGKKIAYSIVVNGENKKLRESFDRAKFLSAEYSALSKNYVAKLYHEIQDKMDGCDAVTGKFYRKRFSESLKLARQKSGITQKKLAQLIGVSVNSCIGYENGRREPSLSIIRRMMNVLKVSADKLIY